ncbi:MAG: hypothetical protein ACRCST_01545 [Turicibacter sp.]
MNNETLKRDLCARLMEGVKGMLIHDLREDFECEDFVEDIEIFNKGAVWTYEGYSGVCIPLGEGDFEGFLIQHKSGAYTSVGKSIKPILSPTSALTKPIQIANYNNGEPFVPIVELEKQGWVINFNKRSRYPFDMYIGVDGICSSDPLDWSNRVIEKLNQWHINYRLSPDQFIEVTDEFNPYL